MDILNNIIALMTKEELRNFKIFARRSHDDDSRKDLQLFDYIRRSGDKFDEHKILKRLYGGSSYKNTYYRLRNRLLTEINKSTVLLHWDKDEAILALHYLSLALLYRKRQQPDIAHYYLRKAEGKAAALDSLEMLDIIYGEYITLSFDLLEINPEAYIQKRNENLRTLNRFREIDNILAAMNYRLRKTQNLAKSDTGVLDLLQKTLEEFAADEDIMSDPKFRFRMYDAVSKILLQQRDYHSLEKYLLATYDAFSEEKLFNKGNHDVKLQMLTYIVNALFKNGKIEASLQWVERLHRAMQEHGRLLYEKYLFFYYNSLVVNYSSFDLEKAIATLNTMLGIESIAKAPQYQVYIYLNLGLFEYARKNYRTAIRHIVKLRLLDAFQTTDEGFRFRVDIFELALRYELNDYETLQYRLGQFRHDYAGLMEDPANAKDKAIVQLIADMNETAEVKKNKGLVERISAFLEEYESDETEIFRYDEFLEAKVG